MKKLMDLIETHDFVINLNCDQFRFICKNSDLWILRLILTICY
uniref:Uncharacterized protein n=1 Tax=viral metagenome TaxID=1070528 RepID=A0A6C0C6T1_9ZZZZ